MCFWCQPILNSIYNFITWIRKSLCVRWGRTFHKNFHSNVKPIGKWIECCFAPLSYRPWTKPNQTKPHSDNKEKSSLKQVCSSILGSISHPSMHSSQLGYYAKWVGDETKNVWKVFGSSISPQARSAFWRCTTITIFVLSLYMPVLTQVKTAAESVLHITANIFVLIFLVFIRIFFTIKLLEIDQIKW